MYQSLNKYAISFLKNNKILLGVIFIFSIWMLFFDNNSLLIQNELDEDIKNLERAELYYTKEIKKDKSTFKNLTQNAYFLEKYAREKLLMNKENEEVFIIETK